MSHDLSNHCCDEMFALLQPRTQPDFGNALYHATTDSNKEVFAWQFYSVFYAVPLYRCLYKHENSLILRLYSSTRLMSIFPCLHGSS